MFKTRNYWNIALFIILLLSVLYFDALKVISTNIESILPKGKKKELLKTFNEFQTSKKLFVYVDGLTQDSLHTIKTIEKELSHIEALQLTSYNTNENLNQYYNDFQFFFNELNYSKLENLDIEEELKTLKYHLLNSDFTYTINTKDPLHLFHQPMKKKLNLFFKENHLALKDKGYLSVFTINENIKSFTQYKDIYKKIHSITHIHNNIKIYSPLFYFVENSDFIQQDMNTIIVLSTLLLIVLYVLILKDIKLLFNTLITLSSSILLALLISSFIFTELSVFIVVFGISISTVAVDYMFHHYVHKAYENQKYTFNKDVFLGMFTTVGAFFILSFIEFDFIQQLCYFTIISLLFSYLQFSFLYPIIGFKYRPLKQFKSYCKPFFSPVAVLGFSFSIILFSLYHFNFDSNLKNLDVENKKLDALHQFFTHNLSSHKMVPYLIKADSIDTLIVYSKQIQSLINNAHAPLAQLIDEQAFKQKSAQLRHIDFNTIQQTLQQKSLELGFKEDFFQEAYVFTSQLPTYTIHYLHTLNLDIAKHKELYLSYVNIPKTSIHKIENLDFIESLSLKTMFEQSLVSAKTTLLVQGFYMMVFLCIVIVATYRKNILIYLCFILFPFASILSMSLVVPFNILHLFILFIILSISIDYGIYISSYTKSQQTNKAIMYSILTTFAGFGVLIFSNSNALFSIGIASTVGVTAILFLILFLKRSFHETQSV